MYGKHTEEYLKNDDKIIQNEYLETDGHVSLTQVNINNREAYIAEIKLPWGKKIVDKFEYDRLINENQELKIRIKIKNNKIIQ